MKGLCSCLTLLLCVVSAQLDPFAPVYDRTNAECKNQISAGYLTVMEDGVPTNYSVVAGHPQYLNVSGSTITVAHGNAGMLAKKCHSKFSPYMYGKFHLLGKTFSFTSDIHQADCGCNASPFFSAVPAFGSDGRPVPGQRGLYQCAAHQHPPCPEMDAIEANKWAYQTTAHKCDPPKGRHYSKCDGGGCHYQSKRGNATAFGPGPTYTINTLKPFRTAITFVGESKLTALKIVMTQGTNHTEVTLSDSNCKEANYLEIFGDQISSHGMGIHLCYWGSAGSRMGWLDSPPCAKSTNCDQASSVTFSDLSISKAN